MSSTKMGFQFPREMGSLTLLQVGKESNLENELYLYDFFRLDPEHTEERPLILCKDGGLMAMIALKGLDPEPMGQEDFDGASAAIRRAMDGFNLDNLDDKWKGGEWELGNMLARVPASIPELSEVERPSKALEFLRDGTQRYWSKKELYEDKLVFWIRFLPKVRAEAERWKMRDPEFYAELLEGLLVDQARMIRRKVQQFEESLLAFNTARPVQGFGLNWLSEEEAFRFLFGVVNRRHSDAPIFDSELPLVAQVAMSGRDNRRGERYLEVGKEVCAVMTWKLPPKTSWGNALREFQDKCMFPFWITNVWQPQGTAESLKKLNGRIPVAQALKDQFADAKDWHDEAVEFVGNVRQDAATPMNWKFSAVVMGKDVAELEARLSKFQSWVRAIGGAEPMEEGFGNRALAELSAIPGNGWMNRRFNLVTSKNAGDTAFVYRLPLGDEKPHLFFGNRRNGYHGFNLFGAGLPNWNSAVLGLPGSGKSVLMNLQAMALAQHPSQIYVIDIGNSFSRFFEWLKKDRGEEVATMRLGAESFSFNPFPLAWAMRERSRQQEEGTWKKALGDGEFVPCPVEAAKIFFEGWLEVLLGAGDTLPPDRKNRLDRALKGENGRGGFFNHYEQLCKFMVEQQTSHPELEAALPEPLTQLLVFVKDQAPEFADSLEYWTRNPQKQFFDSGADALSGAKAVYFELTGLDEQKQLVRPFVAALMGTIWRRIIDPRCLHERKVLIIDEAWKFLADPAFAPVIEGFFRMIRKFNGYVILSTQTPDDVSSGDALKLLRTMSHVWLYKGFNAPEFFKTHLRLTDHQRELHGSLQSNDQAREVFHWDFNGNAQVFRVEVDCWRYWQVTTHAQDKVMWNRYSAFYGGDEAATTDALATACNYQTIPGPALRLRLVEEYAKTHGIK